MSGAKVDIKVVLLGKAYTGKTSLVERYIHNRFSGDTVPYQNVITIGAAFGAKTVSIGNKNVIIGIWDTAGSERYEAMSRIYYRGAKAAIICYDLSDRSSFDRARFWIGELQKHEENCQIHLCGTKYDLIVDNPDLRKIQERETFALAQDVRGKVYETSSKTGKDVSLIFTNIASDYISSLRNKPAQENKEHLVALRNASSKRNFCSGCKI
ncbi:ras-related protein rab-24 [Plakobranchus ocellatus]|uniref:Ras-related protein rab-24 n=1 Tax=Plakobranchus ocellatus TaxID=259542 RepID=A0AAV4CYG0_9GAST|nr:ras-related protein rab-24 [Plakobranchus ocellatus]